MSLTPGQYKPSWLRERAAPVVYRNRANIIWAFVSVASAILGWMFAGD